MCALPGPSKVPAVRLYLWSCFGRRANGVACALYVSRNRPKGTRVDLRLSPRAPTLLEAGQRRAQNGLSASNTMGR